MEIQDPKTIRIGKEEYFELKKKEIENKFGDGGLFSDKKILEEEISKLYIEIFGDNSKTHLYLG